MSNYKSYLLRQLGIKEGQIKSSDVDRDAFPGIDPDELEQGSDEERQEHGFPPDIATKTAVDHLEAPEQGHYYTGVEKAKDAGMLRENPPFSSISPTAKNPSILAVNIRGTPGGMMPTSLAPSDTAIAPEGAGVDVKSKAALGGLDLVSVQKPNSSVIDSTPQNNMINSDKPISDIVPTTPADGHPSQTQQLDKDPVQALTGTSGDGNAPMGEKPEPEKFEAGEEDMSLTSAMPDGIDIDVPRDDGEENPDEKENEEDPIDPHMVNDDKDNENGINETFARHKKLMREKLGIKEEEKTEECKTCGCNMPNTEHPKKTKKLTTERLQSLREHFFKESHKRTLNEQEMEVSKRIISILKNRKTK